MVKLHPVFYDPEMTSEDLIDVIDVLKQQISLRSR